MMMEQDQIQTNKKVLDPDMKLRFEKKNVDYSAIKGKSADKKELEIQDLGIDVAKYVEVEEANANVARRRRKEEDATVDAATGDRNRGNRKSRSKVKSRDGDRSGTTDARKNNASSAVVAPIDNEDAAAAARRKSKSKRKSRQKMRFQEFLKADASENRHQLDCDSVDPDGGVIESPGEGETGRPSAAEIGNVAKNDDDAAVATSRGDDASSKRKSLHREFQEFLKADASENRHRLAVVSTATGDPVGMDIVAPPGRLGFLLADPEPGPRGGGDCEQPGGPPRVFYMRKDSPLSGSLRSGDAIVAVDGEDVSGLAAMAVTKLLARGSKQPQGRRISILRDRTTPGGGATSDLLTRGKGSDRRRKTVGINNAAGVPVSTQRSDARRKTVDCRQALPPAYHEFLRDLGPSVAPHMSSDPLIGHAKPQEGRQWRSCPISDFTPKSPDDGDDDDVTDHNFRNGSTPNEAYGYHVPATDENNRQLENAMSHQRRRRNCRVRAGACVELSHGDAPPLPPHMMCDQSRAYLEPEQRSHSCPIHDFAPHSTDEDESDYDDFGNEAFIHRQHSDSCSKSDSSPQLTDDDEKLRMLRDEPTRAYLKQEERSESCPISDFASLSTDKGDGDDDNDEDDDDDFYSSLAALGSEWASHGFLPQDRDSTMPIPEDNKSVSSVNEDEQLFSSMFVVSHDMNDHEQDEVSAVSKPMPGVIQVDLPLPQGGDTIESRGVHHLYQQQQAVMSHHLQQQRVMGVMEEHGIPTNARPAIDARMMTAAVELLGGKKPKRMKKKTLIQGLKGLRKKCPECVTGTRTVSAIRE